MILVHTSDYLVCDSSLPKLSFSDRITSRDMSELKNWYTFWYEKKELLPTNNNQDTGQRPTNINLIHNPPLPETFTSLRNFLIK